VCVCVCACFPRLSSEVKNNMATARIVYFPYQLIGRAMKYCTSE